jgi:hypothetical protein
LIVVQPTQIRGQGRLASRGLPDTGRQYTAQQHFIDVRRFDAGIGHAGTRRDGG